MVALEVPGVKIKVSNMDVFPNSYYLRFSSTGTTVTCTDSFERATLISVKKDNRGKTFTLESADEALGVVLNDEGTPSVFSSKIPAEYGGRELFQQIHFHLITEKNTLLTHALERDANTSSIDPEAMPPVFRFYRLIGDHRQQNGGPPATKYYLKCDEKSGRMVTTTNKDKSTRFAIIHDRKKKEIASLPLPATLSWFCRLPHKEKSSQCHTLSIYEDNSPRTRFESEVYKEFRKKYPQNQNGAARFCERKLNILGKNEILLWIDAESVRGSKDMCKGLCTDYLNNPVNLESSGVTYEDNSLVFDATSLNSAISIKRSDFKFVVDAITISMWVKVTEIDASSRGCVIEMTDGVTNIGICLHDGSQTPHESTSHSMALILGKKIKYLSYAGPPEINSWMHIVGVWGKSQSPLLYHNGIASGVASESPTDIDGHVSSSWSVIIGQSFVGSDISKNGFNGQIASIQVYTKALSTGEIVKIHSVGREGSNLPSSVFGRGPCPPNTEDNDALLSELINSRSSLACKSFEKNSRYFCTESAYYKDFFKRACPKMCRHQK